MSLAEALARVREAIARAANRAGRSADAVTLVAVTKTVPVARIEEAYRLGLRHFGENRVQEFEQKCPHLAERTSMVWHMIGHLQRNKARRAASLFDCVDSLDSRALAEKLNTVAAEAGRRLPVLIEVRLAPETTKTGVDPPALAELAEAVMRLEHLDLQGLMAIPPFTEDAEAVRPYFSRLRQLRDELSRRLRRPLPRLSMGMSHDFEVAVEEGATEVRLGTALFGPRPAR